MTLAFSQPCERNKQHILDQLKTIFQHSKKVLEIGSGTGQHAEFFSENLSHLAWQASDIQENLAELKRRLALNNGAFKSPIVLDMHTPVWPEAFDAVFTANTVHIIAWPLVEAMIRGVAKNINNDGLFCIYGPFKYNGDYTSQSNGEFDIWLKNSDPARGIRDFEKISELASNAGLSLQNDIEMPANNRLLVWQVK